MVWSVQVCPWQGLCVLVTQEVMGDYTMGGYGCLNMGG
jgi:hypothetical protein